MNVPELPGFAYDPERGRYFRILSTGLSGTSGRDESMLSVPGRNDTSMVEDKQMRSYSVSAMAQRKRKRFKQNGGEKVSENSTSDSLNRYLMVRRLNVQPIADRCLNETRALFLTPSVKNHADRYSYDQRITAIDSLVDGSLLVGTSGGSVNVLNLDSKISQKLYKAPAEITSAHILPEGRLVTTSLGGFRQSGSTVLISRLGPSIYSPHSRPLYHHEPIHEYCSRDNAVWCSAIARSSNSRINVITGGDHSVELFKVETISSGVSKRPDISCHTSSAVLSVCFGSLAPDHFIAGCRSGKILIYDQRSVNNGRHVTELAHPSSVTQMISQGNYLLVSGLRDSLQLYDMRFPKMNGHGRVRHVIKYKQYYNQSNQRHALIARPDNGDFVVSDEDGVSIYDLMDAEPIRKVPLLDKVSAMSWTADYQNLMVACGNEVQKWHWPS